MTADTTPITDLMSLQARLNACRSQDAVLAVVRNLEADLRQFEVVTGTPLPNDPLAVDRLNQKAKLATGLQWNPGDLAAGVPADIGALLDRFRGRVIGSKLYGEIRQRLDEIGQAVERNRQQLQQLEGELEILKRKKAVLEAFRELLQELA